MGIKGKLLEQKETTCHVGLESIANLRLAGHLSRCLHSDTDLVSEGYVWG